MLHLNFTSPATRRESRLPSQFIRKEILQPSKSWRSALLHKITLDFNTVYRQDQNHSQVDGNGDVGQIDEFQKASEVGIRTPIASVTKEVVAPSKRPVLAVDSAAMFEKVCEGKGIQISKYGLVEGDGGLRYVFAFTILVWAVVLIWYSTTSKDDDGGGGFEEAPEAQGKNVGGLTTTGEDAIR